MSFPMVDKRPKVRLRDKKFECLAERRVPDGTRPIDVAALMMAERGLIEANMTCDWPRSGYRWAGYVYFNKNGQPEVIDHRETSKMLEWPTWSGK